jgi:hypothetical protein
MTASSVAARGAIPSRAEAGLMTANINKETVATTAWKYLIALLLP